MTTSIVSVEEPDGHHPRLGRRLEEWVFTAAAFATAAVSLAASWSPGTVIAFVAAVVATLAAFVSLFLERASLARIQTSATAHPVRTLIVSVVALAIGVGFAASTVEIVRLAVSRSAEGVQPEAVVSALAVLLTTAIDPFTRGWREDAGKTMLRWSRNAVLVWAGTVSIIVSGITAFPCTAC